LNGVIFNDLEQLLTRVSRSWKSVKANIIQTSTFYIVRLQITHLLNLQLNVSLMYGPLVIAEPLVIDDCALWLKSPVCLF